MYEIVRTIGVMFIALAMVAGAVGLGVLFLFFAGEFSAGRILKAKKGVEG